MDFLDVMYESLLTEVTADEKYTKQYTGKLDRAVFDKAVALDPTSKGPEKVGKYVDWIIRNKAYEDKDLPEMLSKFEKYKEKLDPAHRDINKMKPTTLATVIDTAEDEGLLVSKTDKAGAEKKKAEEESKIQYQDDELIVITPETEFASQYFGKGADWCTARREGGHCMFDNYDRRGTLYIIKNKKTGKRWQLFKGRGESEYRDEHDELFDPYQQFDGNDEFIAWLKKKDFPNSGEITEEQIDELATDLVREVGVGGDYRDEAHESAMHAVRHEVESLQDADVGDVYSHIASRITDAGYQIEKALDYLEEHYFIDKDDDKNKAILIGSAFYGDLEYDIEHNPDAYVGPDSYYKWVYKFDETAEDIAERIRDFDEVIDYLPAWLDHAYEHNEKDFFTFFDDFTTAMKDEKQTLSKEEEEELKRMIDKAEKKGYKKAGHPELKLDSVCHNNYLDRILNEERS